MVNVTINDKKVQVSPGSTVLQACAAVGIEVPRFCYHERLSIAGNCRMCLVEVEKAAKPVASCAMPVMDGMQVHTDTPLVKKAREGVMEFLLVNHPLDCPICDQGGECDLQDQALLFGNDRGRFYETKRAVKDKSWGPLIKGTMTRCIHCTRCVRFATEIAGVEDFGTTGRGTNTEIGTYIEKTLNSELSGNIIDLCPVGALTSKTYAYVARSWELKHTESIDVSDAIGSNIRVDTRGTSVMRILPSLNEDINEEWISDKARFNYDGFQTQRLTTPMVRDNGGLLVSTDWKSAFTLISDRWSHMKKGSVAGLVGKLTDAQTTLAAKDLINRLGSSAISSQYPYSYLNVDQRSNYLLNSTLNGVADSDLILLVHTNPRKEAPILNIRLRQAHKLGSSIATIGAPSDLTYPVKHLGNNIQTFVEILEGRHKFCQEIADAENPLIIVGVDVLNYVSLESCPINYSVLHFNANQVSSFDLGLNCGSTGLHREAELLFLFGADELDWTPKPNTFVVYIGHHGDAGATMADVILPGSAFTEKDGLFVNTEGQVQSSTHIFNAPGEAKLDWKIIRALSEVLGVQLPYDSNLEMNARLREVCPHLDITNTEVQTEKFNTKYTEKTWYYPTPHIPVVDDFYQTDSICRASSTMAQCSQVKNSRSNF